ncbi:hypothetical protein PWJ82_09510, partial [Actinotignum schaalii]|uniref:hypothetical protein n=1 Tax=Actinotignum schaalii TaxID=59505 RepID=UPI00237DEA50
KASAVEPLAVSGTSVIVIVNPQFLTQIKHLHKLFDTLYDFDPNLCGSYFYSFWIRDKPFGINVRIAFNFGK